MENSRQGGRRAAAGVVAIIVMALMGGALLIVTPFLLFLGLRPTGAGGSVAVATATRLGLPWLVYLSWCVAVGWLLRCDRPLPALLVALCLFGALGWAKAQLLEVARISHANAAIRPH